MSKFFKAKKPVIKNKFVMGKQINFPDCEIFAVKQYQIKANDEEDNKTLESYLHMRPTNFKNNELLINKRNSKILFYYPEFFRADGLPIDDLKNKLMKTTYKYNTEDVILCGFFQKHEVELFFQNLKEFNLEIIIEDLQKSKDMQGALGDKTMTLVLDETNKILYSSRVYIKDYLISFGVWSGLIIFNGLYLPYVNSLINV
jgi:hypothetical protein